MIYHKLYFCAAALGSQCPKQNPKMGAEKNNLSSTVVEHLDLSGRHSVDRRAQVLLSWDEAWQNPEGISCNMLHICLFLYKKGKNKYM